MTVTIAEAQAFLVAAEKSREEFKQIADRSCDEVEKRTTYGKMYTMERTRRNGKYPAWWSVNKIRRLLYFSRLGIPIGRDTSEDGNDSVGATAALLKERLAKNLFKDFDLKDAIEVCRDSLAAVDFAMGRFYYERTEVKQRVKEYLKIRKDGTTGQDEAYDSEGNIVTSDTVELDDDGAFVYLDQVVDVDEEALCFEPLDYKDVFIDPDIIRWARCRRVAFRFYYSKPEFIEMFGREALTELYFRAWENGDESFDKNQSIEVFEYWDAYEKKCYYFGKHSEKFIKPKAEYQPKELENSHNAEARNGPYDLRKFWPCPTPVVLNGSRKSIWPTPEFYQVFDLLLEIDNLFSKIMRTTRAIRPKLMYDNNVDGLEEAVSELNDNEAIGIPGLTGIINRSGGDINNAAQYLDTTKLIANLETYYTALTQRLELLFRLTGINDLLQGLSSDGSGKTLGEREMEQKYALNQVAEGQEKMAEFNRDIYELGCEIALKNFKDETLEKYLIPRTLPPEHKRNYQAAIGLLKQDDKRFRIELETDSTIAINEKYQQQASKELTNVIIESLSKAAEVAETSPELLELDLHALKYHIQSFRGAKLFQGEFTAAIDAKVKSIQEAREAAKNGPPPFDKDQAAHELAVQEFQFEQKKQLNADQIVVMQTNIDNQLAQMKLEQTERLAGLAAQIEQLKISATSQDKQADREIKFQDIQSKFAIAQGDLQAKRDQLMLDAQAITDEGKRAELELMIDASFKQGQLAIQDAEQKLQETYLPLDLEERVATERRLQAEHQTDEMVKAVSMAKEIKEIHTPDPTPEVKPAKKKQVFEMKKDKKGNLISVKAQNEQG